MKWAGANFSSNCISFQLKIDWSASKSSNFFQSSAYWMPFKNGANHIFLVAINFMSDISGKLFPAILTLAKKVLALSEWENPSCLTPSSIASISILLGGSSQFFSFRVNWPSFSWCWAIIFFWLLDHSQVFFEKTWLPNNSLIYGNVIGMQYRSLASWRFPSRLHATIKGSDLRGSLSAIIAPLPFDKI